MVSLIQYYSIPLLCTAIFLFFLRERRRRHTQTLRRKPPPSPPKLPVVGNLFQLGLLPHRSLHSLSRRYGPLIQLHLGGVPTAVVSSAEAAREIMKNQDLTFSTRPKLSIPGRLLYNFKDVGFAPYGEHWRQGRSICVLQLLSNKRVLSYQRVREEETSAMVEKIAKLGSSSRAVNLSDALITLTNDVVCRVAFGKKYGGVGDFKKMLSEFEELMGISPLWEYIPWLSWTRRFDGVDERIERCAKAFDEFLEIVIEEHKASNGRERVGGLDFVDILLELQRENGSSSPIEDDAIKAIILDIFAAGTNTTAAAMEWAMAELIRNPRTMKILQNEVRQFKGEIQEKDLEKMPYLKAVMKESLRLHPPIPLLLPRESTQDTKVQGYEVVRGTRVFINAWAISRDPTVWKNPDEFYPERFLDTSIDYKGQHFELIPFGAGRRGCPGVTFTEAIDELALARLIHTFDFELGDGASMEELDMSESVGMAVHMKFPLLVIATPRA